MKASGRESGVGTNKNSFLAAAGKSAAPAKYTKKKSDGILKSHSRDFKKPREAN
jgi:hypothetical protein